MIRLKKRSEIIIKLKNITLIMKSFILFFTVLYWISSKRSSDERNHIIISFVEAKNSLHKKRDENRIV